MNRATFEKLSGDKKLNALFDCMIQSKIDWDKMDKSVLTSDKKVETTSKEIKHGLKQVSDRVDEVMKKVAGLERGLGELEERTAGLEVEAREVKAKVQVSISANSLAGELDEIQKRKGNLCIYGIKESEHPLVKDRIMEEQSLVSDLLKEVQADSQSHKVPQFKIWNRAGPKAANKIRPLIVEFPSDEAKKEILSNLGRLRGKPQWEGVSIAMDRSRMQRENDKKVYNELKAKKDKANQEMSEEEKNGYQYVIVGRPGMYNLKKLPKRI